MGAFDTSSIRRDCFTCQSRDRSEWCALNDEELRLLDKAKVVREYRPGEVVFHQGEPSRGVHCFETGMVGIRTIDADGNSILFGLAYPGDTLGYRSFLVGEDHGASAEALKPSTICFVDSATVRTLLNHNPALGLQFLQTVARELGAAEERILQSATLNVRARFAHLLLVLRDRYATSGKDGTFALELPLARQDLAAMIGIRPETMSRAIKRLEEDGVAYFSGRSVQVPDVKRLLREIEPEGYM
jgi:CRP-like cAMP-binding protein